MRKLLFSTLLLLSLPTHADWLTQAIKATAEGNGDPIGVLRLAAGYSQSEVFKVKPEADVKDFDNAKGYWGEVDFGAFMYLHFGYSRMADNHSSMDFNNAGLKPTKIRFDKYQYGLKLLLPLPILNPFIGGGVTSGYMLAEDQTPDSSLREHSRFIGAYWHAGFDVLFSPHMGLRLNYQKDTLRTRKFQALGNTKIELEQHVGQAGLLLFF